MFTPITLQYLSSAQSVGGRPGEVESEYETTCVWDGTLSKSRYNNRLLSMGIDVEATILFEEDMQYPNPDSTQVADEDGVLYDIKEVDEFVKDVGLEGSYTLFLKRMRVA